jgi:hypothetical protein
MRVQPRFACDAHVHECAVFDADATVCARWKEGGLTKEFTTNRTDEPPNAGDDGRRGGWTGFARRERGREVARGWISRAREIPHFHFVSVGTRGSVGFAVRIRRCTRAQRRSRMRSNEDDTGDVGDVRADAADDAEDDVKDEPREEEDAGDGVDDDGEGVVNVPRRARTGT